MLAIQGVFFVFLRGCPMKLVNRALLFVSMLLPALACAGNLAPDASNASIDTVSVDKVIRYLDHQAAMRDKIHRAVAPIRNRSDVQAWIESGDFKATPLGALTPQDRRLFLSSVTFNETGITGFRYDILESELNPTQIYRVLSLFGAQGTTHLMSGATVKSQIDVWLLTGQDDEIGNGDYRGYKCVSRANCKKAMFFICMHSC